MSPQALSIPELLDAWALLDEDDRVEGFSLLTQEDAEELFDALEPRDQAELLLAFELGDRRIWIRYLDPDDVADVIQEAPDEQREALLNLLDPPTRKEVSALLAYAEDEAGGLMNPHYARLRPEISVDGAISYLRRQTPQQAESIYYAYVLDPNQRLLGVVSLRDLVTARTGRRVHEIMETDLITVQEDTDQEALSNTFAQHNLIVIPVVDAEGRMKGVVTVDDIVDVFREEATEDMHKIGGTEALDAPYLQVTLSEMLQKRVIWLAVLLVLGFLTVLAMSEYRQTIEKVELLALFVPLIIASGGNSGTQAATLVVRAIALGEVRIGDWWRVVRRELAVGLTLGTVMGGLALSIVFIWHLIAPGFFAGHQLRVGLTVALSILAVASWGTLAGSTLPLVLRSLGLDPASASAPLLSTLVDASGLVIYFTIAGIILSEVIA